MAAHSGLVPVRARFIALLAAGMAALSAIAMTSTATGATTDAAAAVQSPIKHIVVLYLENHSFDDLLGYWCRPNPGRCPDGGMPASVTLSDNTMVTPQVLPDLVPSVAHSVAAQRTAIDGGKMDGWQKLTGCGPKSGYACIAGYQPTQVPNLIALARQFAISDRTFSMAASPSWGGHLYAVMPALDGFTGDNPRKTPGVTTGPGWGCDSNRITPWTDSNGTEHLEPSCIPDYSLGLANGGAFEPTPVKHALTILDRLHAAGRSWRIFGQPTPPNSQFPTTAGYGWDICPSFAECLYGHQKTDNVPSSKFVQVARSGRLPNFAIIIPGGKDAAFSEHNGFSITTGDDWLGQIASAVMHGPQWRSTVLFITWDDCGCFYDQVPPGTNPDGTAQGPRTPLIIVSPYARHGYTDSAATTFAGILGYAEHTLGLTPLGVNDAKAYAFGNAFNYQQAALGPARMVYRSWPRDAYHVNMRQADDQT